MVKHMPTMWETWVWSLGREDNLEKEMATHSSTLAGRIPWMKEPGGLQPMGSQTVGHGWTTSLSSHFIPFWRTIVVSSSIIEMNRAHSPGVSDWRMKYKFLVLTSATPDPTTSCSAWSASDTGALVILVLLAYFLRSCLGFSSLCFFSLQVSRAFGIFHS